ncbi:MAG: flavin-dependent oxidoreductase, F420-dependent methylene-tetrahydromethanopterin reductase [Acidimicrobiales bacterium]|jgi:alkanesulfonate monooxygenase SsuD/methylene tetrahydromethanopterin reductase-like flavin-dependent oxidoreductase (luciferase family)|nr:flavin-dependent oxidoreductase, F420-dependent methylene-tetrahydromethanopterin reductase [Acidimicrobiales bacterium]
MEIGLALPYADYSVPGDRPLRWSTIAGTARRAEALGFASVWLADHLFGRLDRYGGPADDWATYDPIVALSGIARVTNRVRLGTLVLCAQFRPPALLAKVAAGLDVLSHGRVVLGLGAGWFQAEFEAAGIPFERAGVRLRQLADTLDEVRAVLDGSAAVPLLPGPVQRPAPPLWVGGRGDRLLGVVAAHADGWNTVWTMTPDEYRGRLDVLARACDKVGRDPATVTRSLGLHALAGENEADLAARFDRLRASAPAGVLDGVGLAEWRRGRLVGTFEQIAEQLAAWRDLGVAHLILNDGSVPFSITAPDDLDALAAASGLEPSSHPPSF